MLKALVAALLLVPGAVAAQQVLEECSGWQAAARNIPEPWENYSRTFANGNVRVTLLDTVEPAAGAFYLQILSPPYNEMGDRTCVLIAESGGGGIGGLDFSTLSAGYDPARGLTFAISAQRYNPNMGQFEAAVLKVTVNQQTGAVVPWFEDP